MIKRILVLRGKADVGKSTIIRLAYEKLKYFRQVKEIHIETIRSDFVGILEVKGVKVGFASEGDKGIWLEENLKTLKEKKCSMIVCASRTGGETVKVIERMLPTHTVDWIEQKFFECAPPYESNHLVAERIISWIYKYFDAHYDAKDSMVKNVFDNLRNLFICTTLFISGIILLNIRELLMVPILCLVTAWIVIITSTLLTGWNAIHGINKFTRSITSKRWTIIWIPLGAIYIFATIAIFESYVLVIGEKSFPQIFHFQQGSNGHT